MEKNFRNLASWGAVVFFHAILYQNLVLMPTAKCRAFLKNMANS